MNLDDIKALITAKLDATVEVNGDGYHFQVTVVSPEFSGLSKVKRQQMIYGTLQEVIASGELHAITLNPLTPEELKASSAASKSESDSSSEF